MVGVRIRTDLPEWRPNRTEETISRTSPQAKFDLVDTRSIPFLHASSRLRLWWAIRWPTVTVALLESNCSRSGTAAARGPALVPLPTASSAPNRSHAGQGPRATYQPPGGGARASLAGAEPSHPPAGHVVPDRSSSFRLGSFRRACVAPHAAYRQRDSSRRIEHQGRSATTTRFVEAIAPRAS
jgi:hypothetical protein